MTKTKDQLTWFQLTLIGIGCTIGTGYFLGSSIGIKLTGPSIVFAFLIAAFGTYVVFDLLAKMTAADPQESSFCYYTEKAFGRWSGFSCGWNYWCSSILITGSQLIAISILTKAWFPNVPLWVFACIYSVLSILVLLFGTKGFDRVENIFAIIKTAAIFMFIIIAIVALSGGITMKEETNVSIPSSMDQLFSNGFKGF